jgi:NADH:ubiquinone oxidoreductase subunit 3 (subunit A)
MTIWLTHPLVVLLLCSGLGAGIYWLGGRLSPRAANASAENPDANDSDLERSSLDCEDMGTLDISAKTLPYACGEDFVTEEARLSYGRFFRLALMFVVVHMGALVLALLPRAPDTRLLATGYLLGVAVCVDVLVKGED